MIFERSPLEKIPITFMESRSLIFFIVTTVTLLSITSVFLIGFLWVQPLITNMTEGICTVDDCEITSYRCKNNTQTCYYSTVYFHYQYYYTYDVSDYSSYHSAIYHCDDYYNGLRFTCFYDKTNIESSLSINVLDYYITATFFLILFIVISIGLIVFLIYLCRNSGYSYYDDELGLSSKIQALVDSCSCCKRESPRVTVTPPIEEEMQEETQTEEEKETQTEKKKEYGTPEAVWRKMGYFGFSSV